MSMSTTINKTVLSTATGSLCTNWYDAWELTNAGTTTSLYFVPDPHSTPYWGTTLQVRDRLVYDPWTLVHRETAPYESPCDRVVLVSAERAWLRRKARTR